MRGKSINADRRNVAAESYYTVVRFLSVVVLLLAAAPWAYQPALWAEQH